MNLTFFTRPFNLSAFTWPCHDEPAFWLQPASELPFPLWASAYIPRMAYV